MAPRSFVPFAFRLFRPDRSCWSCSGLKPKLQLLGLVVDSPYNAAQQAVRQIHDRSKVCSICISGSTARTSSPARVTCRTPATNPRRCHRVKILYSTWFDLSSNGSTTHRSRVELWLIAELTQEERSEQFVATLKTALSLSLSLSYCLSGWSALDSSGGTQVVSYRLIGFAVVDARPPAEHKPTTHVV